MSGSIATDHLMHFPGRFAEQLLPDRLADLSVSFLVDDLSIRRGGVAANIAFGMARLGLSPALVGAVGRDFGEYRRWLERHGVDCRSVLVSEDAHTARFVCTTDDDMCQIAAFHPGAMARSADIRLASVADRLGGLDLVIVGADDPRTMLSRADECRRLGFPFAADPSQQLARMDGAEVLRFIDGANYLLTNEYERGLLEAKTGLGPAQVLDRVGLVFTTLGGRGVHIAGRRLAPVTVAAAATGAVRDPTGVGDGFRSGLFAGLAWGLPVTRAAQVGNALAACVIEAVGTQEYELDPDRFVDRIRRSYGAAAARDVGRRLPLATRL